MNLTRSAYLASLQCLKRVYLQYHDPGLAAAPDSAIRMFTDQGRWVGDLARQAVPGGVLVEWDGVSQATALARTAQLVADPAVRAIYEGAFEFDNAIVRVDILERMEEGAWRLIEVKSAAGVKEQHLHEIALQKYVLQGCGLTLGSVCSMYLNRSYLYGGGEYDLSQLFSLRDVTAGILPFERRVLEVLPQAWDAVQAEHPPDITPGPQCTRPNCCEFYAACNETSHPEDWIGHLIEATPELLERLRESGIESIGSIPPGIPLNPRQIRARESILRNGPVIENGLEVELEALRYPLLFMDFEACGPALPRFPGMHPFDAIPFQWSIHSQEAPGAEPVHHEFLDTGEADPREAFLDSLLEVTERCDGSIVVYNKDFESDRLKELAACFPDRAGRAERVRARLWDLCAAIQKYVYHPGFRGSFSIKSVLPALVPGLSYSDLPLSNGVSAGAAWYSLVVKQRDAEEHERLSANLRAYCELDSLAMLRLVEKLREIAGID